MSSSHDLPKGQEQETPSSASNYDESLDVVAGLVHSIDSFSAVDGPGIRFLVFMQGCPRRCLFCSNPDTWGTGGTRMTVGALGEQMQHCLPYLKPNRGGLTISGGEPMCQARFVGALMQKAHSLGVTTAIDTTGWGSPHEWNQVLPHTDLVMLCPKAMTEEMYSKVTGGTTNTAMLAFCKEVAARKVPMCLRYVLLPGYTDTDDQIERYIQFAKEQPTLQYVEMLPYHLLGVSKWKNLGLEYPLEGLQTPSKAHVETIRQRFVDAGIPVL